MKQLGLVLVVHEAKVIARLLGLELVQLLRRNITDLSELCAEDAKIVNLEAWLSEAQVDHALVVLPLLKMAFEDVSQIPSLIEHHFGDDLLRVEPGHERSNSRLDNLHRVTRLVLSRGNN